MHPKSSTMSCVLKVLRKKYAALFVLLVAGLSLRSQAQVPQSDHVFVLMEENHSYGQVIGNSAMPYLNSLAKSYAIATNYDANSHYSIPNYFWITTGAYVTLSDNTTQMFDVNNVTRYLNTAGKTWKAYEESLPYAGYVGPSKGNYQKNHDPFSYFTDVVNSSQKLNIVPFTQLATDISNNNLPSYAFIKPNGLHDGHNGSLSTADTWLKTNIAPLLATPPFQAGGNGILFITFDESVNSDCRPLAKCPKLPENGGGGRVATLIISPLVKTGYKSSVFYQHPSVLKTMLLALGISGAPGAAQSAPPMDVFRSSSSACAPSSVNPSVTICTPSAGQTVSSPVHIAALTTDSKTVNLMQIYVDGVKKYQVYASSLDTSLAITSGTHRLAVQASDGTIFKQVLYITVQ
jgi:phosphatidylinositol-3-phosphatase